MHGGLVIRVDPRSGALLQSIAIPAQSVSAVEWGGPDQDVLYVTTARFQLDEQQLREQPLAGSTFSITGLGTRGRAAVPYNAVSTVSR